jgi:cephalosporin hydroxylase
MMADADFEKLQMIYLREYCERQIWRNVRWNGVEFWQIPEDVVALAQAIHESKCDVVIEAGVNAGGGIEFYSTLLASNPKGLVIGIDVFIERAGSVADRHPGRVNLVGGDSISPETIAAVKSMIEDRRVLVILDSDHRAAHVAKELELYAPLVSPGSYMVVFDGAIKDLVGVWQMPADAAMNNPETAIREFLPRHPEFERDYSKNWFGMTWAPGGFLKKKT